MGNDCCTPVGGETHDPMHPNASSSRADPRKGSMFGEPVVGVEPSGELIRIFLVGSGEVGKSTLVKQMQKLCIRTKGYEMYDDNWNFSIPFNDDYRLEVRPRVYQNIFRIIATLIEKARLFSLRFDNPEHEAYADEIMEYIGQDVDRLFQKDLHLTPDMARKIYTLWTHDQGAIHGAWNRRREFLLSDSATYFLEWAKLEEVSSPSYRPTEDDILRVRAPTTNVHDNYFRLHRVKFSIRDVGGQPMERQRWIKFLSDWLSKSRPGDRNFILYVASLADYNQRMPNYPDKTRLDESISLLAHLLNLEMLQECGFILFLNKEDIFQQKLEQFNDFNEYFHEYFAANRGRNMDRRLNLSQAERVVASKFAEAVAQTIRDNDQLYCRFIKAIDTKMMESIFAAVRNDIMHDLIRHGNWVPFP